MVDSEFIDRVLADAQQKDLRIVWVLETHAHADHLTAAGEIRRRTGARIACGKNICSVQETFARVFNMTDLATDGRQFDRLLEEGDRIDLGALEIRVIETPGHTNDSVTYLVEDAAFIGDTLFAPSFGTARCDFPGGDAGQLYDSISKIYRLPGETRIFLCHDYPPVGNQPLCQITVAESRNSNIHFSAETIREEFVAMRTARDAQLGLPRLILPSLQVNIQAGEAPAAEINGVAYLRTPFNRKIADLI
jgi:glyoxylase-like metal-dependent hydrolase (beta-lactamase superfamily II)